MRRGNYQNFIKNNTMNSNQDMGSIYELLEKSDFADLSENDRERVLLEMTTSEYNSLRSTLKDTDMYFSNAREIDPEKSVYETLINIKKQESPLIRILRQPVQLYKVAAAIILLTGLFSLIHFTNLHEQNTNTLSNDTIFIYKTDTVYSRLIDTVKHIREKVVYISHKNAPEREQVLFMTARNDYESMKQEDFDRIKALFYPDIPDNYLIRD